MLQGLCSVRILCHDDTSSPCLQCWRHTSGNGGSATPPPTDGDLTPPFDSWGPSWIPWSTVISSGGGTWWGCFPPRINRNRLRSKAISSREGTWSGGFPPPINTSGNGPSPFKMIPSWGGFPPRVNGSRLRSNTISSGGGPWWGDFPPHGSL